VTPNLRPRDELIEYFANLGRQGFKRQGLLWYRHADETSCSFELQRSSYSTLYFANLGVSFAAVGGTPELRPHRCHLYGRLPHVDALDFSRDIASGQRATALDEFQARVVLPAANVRHSCGCGGVSPLGRAIGAAHNPNCATALGSRRMTWFGPFSALETDPKTRSEIEPNSRKVNTAMAP